MNWYKIAKRIPIYRGEHSGNKGGGYFSTNKEFARQFTQSGLDREVIVRQINLASIYDARTEGKPLPEATNETDFDNAMIRAKELGLYGFRLTEGPDLPDSIYIFNKAIL